MANVENSENVEMSQNKTDEEFVTVSRQSRKRKQTGESMDTSDTTMKRPHLPPVSGNKLLVWHAVGVIFRPCGRKTYVVNAIFRSYSAYASNARNTKQ